MTREELLRIAKPILFNTEMVRAILDDRKTVTKRYLKQPFTVHPNGYITKPRGNENLCPYIPPYKTGDILYVRETWNYYKHNIIAGKNKGYHEEGYFYKASPEQKDALPKFVRYHLGEKWHPSIHMPKEAARIWLKITDIRVERLQEMIASESAKEGIRLPKEYETKERAYILGFADLWDSTIKKSDLDRYGWDANPWVWVIEFERMEV